MLSIKAFKNYSSPAFVNGGASHSSAQSSFHTNANGLLKVKNPPKTNGFNVELYDVVVQAPRVLPLAVQTTTVDPLSFVYLESKPCAEVALEELDLGGDFVHNQAILSAMRETLHSSKDPREKGKVFHRIVSALSDPCLSWITKLDLQHLLIVFNDIKAFNKLNLRGLDFSGCDLRGLDLSKSDLHDALLSNASCCHTILTGADMTGVVAIYTDFAKAIMTGANLSHSEMPHASFEGAQLNGAKMFGIKLAVANLKNANLAGAILNDANMTLANVANADVAGAKFLGAILEKVNLSAAKNARHAILIENLYQFSPPSVME